MLRLSTTLLVLLVLALGADARAEAVLLDRIAAVVETKTILRSDILARARPYVGRLEPGERTDPTKLRAIHREVLDRMIDEELIAVDAEKIATKVNDEEIERALTEVGKQNKLGRAELIAELKKQGMSFDEYRDEVRRQLLDLKWTNIRVRPTILEPKAGNAEEKAQAIRALVEIERRKRLAHLRAQAFVEIRP